MAALLAASLARRSASFSSTSSSCMIFKSATSPLYLHYFSTTSPKISQKSLSNIVAAAFGRRSDICNCCISSNSNYVHILNFSTKNPLSNTIPESFPQDFFTDKYQLSPQIASKAASFTARMRNPQNAVLVLSFLRDYGFSNSQLERLLRFHPALLSSCLESKVKPKLDILLELGFSAPELPHIVSRDYMILQRDSNDIIRSLSVLRRLLGSNDNVIKLIRRKSMLFYTDPEKTILPNIEFLKTCGVQADQINSLIYTYTPLILLNPENVRRCVNKADQMGVQRTSRLFIHAVKAISKMSGETLELKLKSFQDLGFSEDDILRVFRCNPMVLTLSAKKMNEVKEVLLETGKYDMSTILKYPTSLSYSVEKRYKPRLQVLKVLERKSLINEWPTVSTLCILSNKRFFEKFVAPYMKQPKG